MTRAGLLPAALFPALLFYLTNPHSPVAAAGGLAAPRRRVRNPASVCVSPDLLRKPRPAITKIPSSVYKLLRATRASAAAGAASPAAALQRRHAAGRQHAGHEAKGGGST